jgi:disulfide bond formation protein DsbB
MINLWPSELMSTNLFGFVMAWFAVIVFVVCLVCIIVWVVAHVIDLLKEEN